MLHDLARLLHFPVWRRPLLSPEQTKKIIKSSRELVDKLLKEARKDIERAKETLREEAKKQGKKIKL